MWEYNKKYDIHISLSHTTLTAQREGDVAIMKLAQQIFKKKAERRSIQHIRMKLGVVHLSDISIADGNKMEPNFYSTSLPSIKRNVYDYPIKYYVNQQDIFMWRKFLR